MLDLILPRIHFPIDDKDQLQEIAQGCVQAIFGRKLLTAVRFARIVGDAPFDPVALAGLS